MRNYLYIYIWEYMYGWNIGETAYRDILKVTTSALLEEWWSKGSVALSLKFYYLFNRNMYPNFTCVTRNYF